MIRYGDKKLFKPIYSANDSEHDIKKMEYIIEKIDDFNYAIHRELDEVEIEQYFGRLIFCSNDKLFLHGVAVFLSEYDASLAILSYWDAVDKLNLMECG